MQTIANFEEAMESIAPSDLAEAWDNVGLLLGDRTSPLKRVLLCIDLTEPVLAEALRKNAGAIVAYHPPLFKPINRIEDSSSQGRLLLGIMSAGIAVYSPHTAADAAEGGVNDWLAAAFGTNSAALRPAAVKRPTQAHKIVTFVPADRVEALRHALADSGAGDIGDYSICSFATPGIGTFLGGRTSNPAIGAAGHLEHVDEVRLEMVCSEPDLARALDHLRSAHPYEEAPIDVQPLLPQPTQRFGAGRMIHLETPLTFADLAERLRTHIGTNRLIGHNPSPRRRHEKLGVCAGSGADLLDEAVVQGCTLFVTGEMRHHDVLRAVNSNCAVLLAGHTNTERGWLKVLRKKLISHLDGVEITQSRADSDPLRNL